MHQRLSRRSGLALAGSLFAAAATLEVAAQRATPAATPVALIPDLPSGPLGEQLQWLVDLLNGDPANITGDAIESHLAPIVLAELPATDLAAILGDLARQIAPVHLEPRSLVTTRNVPPTTAQFVLVGRDTLRLLTTLSVDGESGLITGLYFQPAPVLDVPPASPAASPTA